MSKVKQRASPDIFCADCSAPDPQWASVNRGVMICNDCASIHQGLGRHISQVKHIKKSYWHPHQLKMVQQLTLIGANSIWEHSLLDPSQGKGGKKKPHYNDLIHPVKEDYIRMKYEQLAFVNRQLRKDDDDLGKQLHSSVRTGNLDTSLRLLSIGAQVNYLYLEKGNSPLHVAAKSGQHLQVELLVSYGADPAAPDTNNHTPEEIARNEGHIELAERLVELQYELPDRLSYFVGKVRPDHKSRNHFIIPKLASKTVRDGKIKLQALSNNIFEVLAVDVYDEIDRRETDRIWQDIRQRDCKSIGTKSHFTATPFLTLNPDYSTTRNQGRQKLARFSHSEFTVLIHDVLCDIVRRQCGKEVEGLVEEDPIYDIPPDSQVDQQETGDCMTISRREYDDFKDTISNKDKEIEHLQELNRDLTIKVTMFAKENLELKRKQQNTSAFKKVPLGRPKSVYNTGSNDTIPQPSRQPADQQRRQTIIGPSATLPSCLNEKQRVDKEQISDSKKTNNNDNNNTSSCKTPVALLDPFADEILTNQYPKSEEMPIQSIIIEKTTIVTKKLSHLHQSAQKRKIECYKDHGKDIYEAVLQVIFLFPPKNLEDNLHEIIKRLFTGVHQLQQKCDVTNPSDALTDELIKSAYEIAKAEKELMTVVNGSNETPT